MINVCVLDKNTINDPMFDLIPDKHGHILDKDLEIKEVNGIRMTVPFLDINSETLHEMSEFIDEMDGTLNHENMTIIIKEKDQNIPSQIGIFAL